VSICVGYYEWSLPTLCGKGGPLSPVCSYHSHASTCFCINGPSVWNGLLLSCASYLGRFPTHSIVVFKLFVLNAPLGSMDMKRRYTFNHSQVTTSNHSQVTPSNHSLTVLMARRCGMASLLGCASYLGRFPTHSIVVLKLFFLTVLELGAPLSSSGLEEAL